MGTIVVSEALASIVATIVAALAPPVAAQSPSVPVERGATGEQFDAPSRADRPVRLRLDPRIAPTRRMEQGTLPTHGRADRMRTSGPQGQTTTVLDGNAELRQIGTQIRADSIRLREADQQVQARGSVTVDRAGNRMTGPSLDLKLDAGTGVFDQPTYQLAEEAGRGRADRLELLGDGRFRLDNAMFTTCRPESEDWRIEARRLDIDQNDSQGVGRTASLVFKDVHLPNIPIFYFPLGDERKSGFLSPTFSVNSRAGAEVAVPYYFNLAPNYDLTLTPIASLRRGLQLATDFRYLFQPMRGEVHHEWVPQDARTGRTRYFYAATNAITGLGGWNGGWNIKGVSDDTYFVDFSRTIVDASERSLPRDIYLTRDIGGWNLLGRVTSYQNILDARLAPPYEKLPQLRLSNFMADRGGFDFGLLNDLTWFKRPLGGAAEGLRAVVNPSVSYPMRGSYWFVTPRASVNLASYQLQSNPAGPEDLSRTIPTFSLDSGLIMERPIRWQGREMTQTLEPRLFYVRTPFRDQSQFPVFDSVASDFNFVQLFSENPYTGYDRIADVNQLTAALLSRYIDGPTGIERLRLAIAERFYFSEQRVTLPGVRPRTDNRSDLLLAASADLGSGHGFDTGVQYAMRSSEVPRYTAVYRYWPRERDRLFNFGIYFQTDEYAQWSTSWQWPITRRWNTLGKINYSFLAQRNDPSTGRTVPVEKGLVEGVLGFEYKEDCYTTRFVAQRFVTAAGQYTSAFFVQLDLRGLGRIGTDPFTILIRNIPGYRVPDNRVQMSNFYGNP
ncbi:MAG: LPS assembly protein LptD [Burkholderiaceae bacterium]